jgi:hypothetical protein
MRGMPFDAGMPMWLSLSIPSSQASHTRRGQTTRRRFIQARLTAGKTTAATAR